MPLLYWVHRDIRGSAGQHGAAAGQRGSKILPHPRPWGHGAALGAELATEHGAQDHMRDEDEKNGKY